MKTTPKIDEIRTETMLVTPQWAKQQIEEMERRVEAGKFRQRPMRERAIKRYARDMINDNWLVTHQGIAFDTAGNLLDGQNRLRAVIMANKPAYMRVTYGIPEETEFDEIKPMDTIDLGVNRNLWQALQVSHGYGGEAVELSSIARHVMGLVLMNPNRPKDPSPGITVAQGIYILEDLGIRAAADVLQKKVQKPWRIASFSAPWCWYWTAHRSKAERFATEYAYLEELQRDDPAMKLNRYITTRKNRPRQTPQELMAVTAQSLHAFHKGEKIQQVRGSDAAVLWLLKQNWPLAEKINQLMLGEKIPSSPQNEKEAA